MTAAAVLDVRTDAARTVDGISTGNRVAALDGVRALAVVAVLGIHAVPGSTFPGGVGVDLFFVLSGCLITALLLAERDRFGRVDLPRFWLRRFLRLLPALAFFLLALYPLGRAMVGEEYVGRALTVLAFRANLALTVDLVSVGPLEHLWSLAQEGQFYLVWPPVLLLLWVLRLSQGVLALLLLAGTAWSFLVLERVQAAGVRPSDDFRLDARLGGLLVGCALALLLHRRTRLLAVPWLAEAGLLGLLSLLVVGTLEQYDLQVTVPVAVGCSALLVGGLLGGPPGPASALLSAPGPAYLGQVSYSLYLWHYPFFRAFERREDLPGALVLLLEVVLAVAAAAMSYTVIEQPVSRWSARRLRPLARPDHIENPPRHTRHLSNSST